MSPTPARGRQIGAIGTLARIVLGLALLFFGVVGGQVIVIHGHLESHFELPAFVLGVIVLPAVLVGLQWLRIRFAPARLQATGPWATVLNILVFLALVSTPAYVPQLSVL